MTDATDFSKLFMNSTLFHRQAAWIWSLHDSFTECINLYLQNTRET